MNIHTFQIFKKILLKSGKIAYALLMCALLVLIGTNCLMYLNSRSEQTLNPKEFAIVLGASVHGEELSGALKARMETAIYLYENKLVRNILVSGDGTDSYYNETFAMKKFALKKQVPEEAIISDEKGYNTYASMLRAKEVFNTKSAYIISQKFHLTRAVWIAREVGIDADGVSAGSAKETPYYDLREFFARTKDFFQVMLKLPAYQDENIF